MQTSRDNLIIEHLGSVFVCCILSYLITCITMTVTVGEPTAASMPFGMVLLLVSWFVLHVSWVIGFRAVRKGLSRRRKGEVGFLLERFGLHR